MDRGSAMLAVVREVYEGGKDLIPRLDAEGTRGKRARHRWRRRAPAILRGVLGRFGRASENNSRT